jgi:hypothetical protein
LPTVAARKREEQTKETNRTHSGDAQNSSNTLQRNDFHVGPPRGPVAALLPTPDLRNTRLPPRMDSPLGIVAYQRIPRHRVTPRHTE